MTTRGSAIFSPDGRYRYRLDRVWAHDAAMVAVLLNPSAATDTTDDPTLRRVTSFARAAGCGRVVVVNLYGWRASHPTELRQVSDPVGPDNDVWIAMAAAEPNALLVAGWGTGARSERVRTVRELLGGSALMCLGRTAAGHPRHPLYRPSTAQLVPF